MPLPGPPEINSQGWRTTCHIPANSTRGLPGTMTRSDTHVVSFTNRTFCHVLPPSAVRYTPRSAFAAQVWPTAPTNTTSGFVGSITIREICPTLPRPMKDQVLPASGEKNTPRPSTMSLRMFASPVPTQTRLGLEGAKAMAPIDAVGWSLKTASQESPPSVVFHTPPDRKSTRLNSSHSQISYAVFCLKKKKKHTIYIFRIRQQVKLHTIYAERLKYLVERDLTDFIDPMCVTPLASKKLVDRGHAIQSL